MPPRVVKERGTRFVVSRKLPSPVNVPSTPTVYQRDQKKLQTALDKIKTAEKLLPLLASRYIFLISPIGGETSFSLHTAANMSKHFKYDDTKSLIEFEDGSNITLVCEGEYVAYWNAPEKKGESK